jgi:predicted RNase H-like nuclease (RuvC/YqgF family)
MEQSAAEQLEKVLALADSDHAGEALVALRKARQILARENLSFGELVRSANRSRFSLARSLFSGSQVELEAQLAPLQRDIKRLTEESQSQSVQLDFWRRRAFELEQQLNLSQSETQRWKQMARETAEKLWDIGQLTNGNAFVSADPLPEEDGAPLPLKATG